MCVGWCRKLVRADLQKLNDIKDCSGCSKGKMSYLPQQKAVRELSKQFALGRKGPDLTNT